LKPEVVYRKGDPDRPLVIFIHGLGMDANIWVEPSGARVLGGRYPLSVLIGNMTLRNSFHDLNGLGFPVLTWSQQRPAGEAAAAFEELCEIISAYEETAKGLILIGHSRGGLLARKLSDEDRLDIRAVITLAAPHHGSTIAKWADHISPVASGLKMVLDTHQKNAARSALQKIAAFLSGSGIREMLPDSGLIRSLRPYPAPGVKTISIGGTDPSLVKIGGKPLGKILSGIIPEKMLPDELREGMGDGFVAAASSVWPGCCEHRNFHAHHAGLIFDPNVREYIRKIVKAWMWE
jgi:pimeloyl-ACP methyl ester carboxylesterase